MIITAGSAFFQVAATLLATLLISGVLAEVRARSRQAPWLRWWSVLLFVVAAVAVAVGEVASLGVLLGQAPIAANRAIVLVSLLVATVAVVFLAGLQFAVRDLPAANGNEQLSTGKLSMLVGALFIAAGIVIAVLTLNRGQVTVVDTCPGAPTASAFQGVVASPLPGPAAVRTGAGISSNFKILRRYPSGCPLGFKGYCLGQPVPDFRAPGLPDGRWFILDGVSGYIASAVIDGTPPPGMKPQHCPGSLRPPTRVQLIAPRTATVTGTATIVARATDAPYISFVAWYPDTVDTSTTPYRWHQLGVVTDPTLGAVAQWDTRLVPGGRVVLAAVACLAVSAPSSAHDARRYTVTPPATPSPRFVPPPSLAAAASIACGTPRNRL